MCYLLKNRSSRRRQNTRPQKYLSGCRVVLFGSFSGAGAFISVGRIRNLRIKYHRQHRIQFRQGDHFLDRCCAVPVLDGDIRGMETGELFYLFQSTPVFLERGFTSFITCAVRTRRPIFCSWAWIALLSVGDTVSLLPPLPYNLYAFLSPLMLFA